MLVGSRFLFVLHFARCSLFLCGSVMVPVCCFCLCFVWIVRFVVGCWYCCVYVGSVVFVHYRGVILHCFVGCFVSHSVVRLCCLVLPRLCFAVVFSVLLGRGVVGAVSLGG